MLHQTRLWLFMLALLALTRSVTADDSLVAWWSFEDTEERSALDSIGNITDRIHGRIERPPGVSESCLCFDGFTTRVVRAAKTAPNLGDAFTFEAWIAVRAYPWGWCPIVSQRSGEEVGYFFGVDAMGRVGVKARVGSEWNECVSEKRLSLGDWTHVACTFDSTAGLQVHINGELVAERECRGQLASASDIDLILGRNHAPEPVMFENNSLPAHYSFDGVLDEVKIYRRALSPDEVRLQYASQSSPDRPHLHHARLPSGEPSSGQFGAFYENLQYLPAWDALWRGSGPDVVVVFDKADYRFVCWRGASYAPCWVTEKGNWFTNEFMERGVDRPTRGCTESMSDKRAEYSHVKILENHDARTVVYWRNSPVDIYYQKPYVDDATGWGDWSEEYHTIYPDGVAVRKVVMYSGDFDEWCEWCQSIQPLHPGQRPEDVLDAERIVSLANMRGETHDYGWPEGAKAYKYPTLPSANIQITFLKSRHNPFLILDDRPGLNDVGGDGPAITLVGGEGWSQFSPFPWRNHWPVTQIPIIGRHAVAADRAAHTYTATQHSAAFARTDKSMTKVMLCGMTERDQATNLLPLARSWLRPPVAKSSSEECRVRYEMTERAYIVDTIEDASDSPLLINFDASEASPLVNPAIVIKNWGNKPVQLLVNGKETLRGDCLRYGHRRSLEGTDLVVWLELVSTRATTIALSPAEW